MPPVVVRAAESARAPRPRQGRSGCRPVPRRGAERGCLGHGDALGPRQRQETTDRTDHEASGSSGQPQGGPVSKATQQRCCRCCPLGKERLLVEAIRILSGNCLVTKRLLTRREARDIILHRHQRAGVLGGRSLRGRGCWSWAYFDPILSAGRVRSPSEDILHWEGGLSAKSDRLPSGFHLGTPAWRAASMQHRAGPRSAKNGQRMA